MKALKITLNHIDKMAFIFQLGSYCIVNSSVVEAGAYESGLQEFWESDYLKRQLNNEVDFELLWQSDNWERSYAGLHIQTLDNLLAILILSVDFSIMFFDNNEDNIAFWKESLKRASEQNDIDIEKSLFDINKKKIGETNEFQVWPLKLISNAQDASVFIVTGTIEKLEEIERLFNLEIESSVMEYNVYSFDDDNLEWIDL